MSKLLSSITVSNRFSAGASTFSRSLQIPIEAETMVVRQITYGGTTSDIYVSVIRCDVVLPGDTIIGHVFPSVDGVSIATAITPNAEFTIDKQKARSGVTTFQMINAEDGSPNVLADGILVITLEFVKHIK